MKLPQDRRRVLETVLGVLFVLAIVLKSGTRAMIRVWLIVAFDQGRALYPLLRADGAGTAATLGLMLGRLGLALIPSLFLIRAAPPQRRIWLIAAVSLAVIFCSPMSLSSCATMTGWLLLVGLSIAASLLVRVRFMGWTACLPFVVLLSSMPSHVLAARRSHDPAFRESLLAECGKRAGQRPANLAAEQIKPPHAISPLTDDLFLLTGQGQKDDVMFGAADDRPGSWWLRRRDGRLVFDQLSAAEGRFWRACLLDGELFTAQSARVVGVRRLPNNDEEISRFQLPSKDIDMGDTACDPVRHRLYIGEGTLGAIWELNPDSKVFRRHEIGRVALLPMRRFDGKIVINSTAALNVFAPGEDRVIERAPSALLSVGFDLCSADGTAAVADEAGRLRIFELDRDGHYQFAWGLPLFAPRRVAYSPDCSRIAVTSSDDHSVFIIETASRSVKEVYQAGPALREVTATGAREFSVTDACAVTSYHW